MANTGIKTVFTLRKYVNGVATDEIKNNDPGDPDYIAPYEDLVDCPIPTTTTTSTAAPTTTTTSTAAPTTTTTSTAAPTTTTTSTAAPTTTTTSTAAPTTTTTSTAAPTTTTTTAIQCYEYEADVPQQSGESLEVTYIDCDGVEQYFVYYWNSGVSSVQWCARSIVGATYPVNQTGSLCGDNQPLPTTTTTTTAAPTTTTTTTATLACDSYYNNTGSTLGGIRYYDCNGILVSNVSVDPGEDICASQPPFDGDAGFLIFNGECGGLSGF